MCESNVTAILGEAAGSIPGTLTDAKLLGFSVERSVSHPRPLDVFPLTDRLLTYFLYSACSVARHIVPVTSLGTDGNNQY